MTKPDPDYALAVALRALAYARPAGTVATATWNLCRAVAERYGAEATIHDLGHGPTAQAEQDMCTALRALADIVAPPAPTLTDMLFRWPAGEEHGKE